MKKYKVKVPIGRKEKAVAGWGVGEEITDKDLPKEVIRKFLEAKFIVEVSGGATNG